MKNLIIIGAGGFAREIYWHAPECVGFGSDWTVKGFLDGDVKLSAEEYQRLPSDVPLLGDIDGYEIEPDDVFTCAIGTPAVRNSSARSRVHQRDPSQLDGEAEGEVGARRGDLFGERHQ